MKLTEREIIYKTFAKLCYYPDQELIDLLNNGVITQFLKDIDPENRDIKKLDDWLKTFRSSLKLLEALQVEYTSLFITNFPSIPAPMFKSYYFEKEILGASTEKILDIYEHFNFEVSESVKEPADHLAIMLEFIYRLIPLGNTYPDQIDFIQNHVLSWMKPFEENIISASSSPFYPVVIKAIINYLKKDVTQFEIKLAGAEL